MKPMNRMIAAGLSAAALAGAPALAQDAETQPTVDTLITSGSNIADPSTFAATAWQAAPLASALMGVLAQMTAEMAPTQIENAMLDALFARGLVEGELPLDTVNAALTMLMQGDWPANVEVALSSLAARVAAEVGLENMVASPALAGTKGPLGPPPAGGDVLGGSDYEN